MQAIVDPDITCYYCGSLNFNWYAVNTGCNFNDNPDTLFPICHDCHDDEVLYCDKGELDPDNHAYFIDANYIKYEQVLPVA